MKFWFIIVIVVVGLVLLLFVTVAQSRRGWVNIKPKDTHVIPEKAALVNPKIVKSQEAIPGQYPFQVALKIDGRKFCGGSIIREDVILTAAHCVDSASSVEVVAGAHNIRQTESTQQSVTSTNFIVHKDWNLEQVINDIALVILPQPLTINDRVQTIALKKGACSDSSIEGIQATFSGWGSSADVLRCVSNNTITNSTCNSYFGDITDTHICLDGSGGRRPCPGDSGGPLFESSEAGVQQIGIVSYGQKFVEPTVYTRVPCFTDWIESKLPKMI